MSRKVFRPSEYLSQFGKSILFKAGFSLGWETFVRMIAPGHYEWPCTPSCCCCCRRCYCCRRGCQWGRKSTAVANEERRAPDICVCPRRLLTAAAAGRILERTARERGRCLSLRRSGRYCRGGGGKKKKKKSLPSMNVALDEAVYERIVANPISIPLAVRFISTRMELTSQVGSYFTSPSIRIRGRPSRLDWNDLVDRISVLSSTTTIAKSIWPIRLNPRFFLSLV